MVDVKVYVEGGGRRDSTAKCRQAFQSLFRRAGLKRNPSVVPCGSRSAAIDRFRTALRASIEGTFCVLLVDSEAAVSKIEKPWHHLKTQYNWNALGIHVDHAHLMIQCMETWIATDSNCLRQYFGQGFKATKLPQCDLETLAPNAVLKALQSATRECRTKGKYDKNRDSFALLGQINPATLKSGCRSAKRFFAMLEKRCNER